MKTALADPEDDEPGRDKDWYRIDWFGGQCSTTCNVCGTGFFGGTEEKVKDKLILCGIGHILAGRSFP